MTVSDAKTLGGGRVERNAPAGCLGHNQRVSDAISIRIMIQDAPVSGAALSAPFRAAMAREIANVSYLKVKNSADGEQDPPRDRRKRRCD
jgi:hypothetical protein